MTEIFTKSQAAKIEPSYYCESFCAYKDKVFIGTKQGVVIVYSVNYEKQDDKSVEVKGTFNFIIRDFNRKPITQIELAEEFGICFFLSNGIIYVYRLKDYKLIHSTDLKYISKFCLDIYNQNERTPSSSHRSDSYTDKVQNDTIFASSITNADALKPSNDLRICLISKKKLMIMNWDKEKYTLKPTENTFRLPDNPIAVQFFHNFLCVATKFEYMLINISSGDNKPLFNVGKSQDPFILRISDLIGLKIDDSIEFINKDGNFLTDNSLRGSFVPSVLLYHPPFIISLCEKFIEVRMITTGILIQSLIIENSSLICRYCDRLYVLSDKKLIFLNSKSRQQQVQMYADNKDFETALILAKTAPLVGEGEIDCGKINIQYALNLFENRLFEKAFNIFFDIISDPSNVLNLFPSLCPKKITNNDKVLDSNSEIAKDFTEQENTEAIRALIDFLVKWRNKLRKSQENILCISITNGKNIEKSKSTLQKIIDTSLLKCYLIINSPLVAPLLRQENFCHVDEAKKTLEKYEKFQELVLLYENHGMHDEALKLLHSQCVKTHTSLCGHQPTINYMKNLSPQYLPLIYQYGDWILKQFPMDWINIFTHWYQKEKTTSKDESLRYFAYKDDVLKHLQEIYPKMVIPFLERIIYENNNNDEYDLDVMDYDNKEPQNLKNSLTYKLMPLDETNGLPIIINPPFAIIDYLHTCYVNSLIEEILPLNPVLLHGLPIKNELNDASSDFKYLQQLRNRLKLFLQSPNSKYNAERVLVKLPYDGFYEERTILLARAGKHEQALTLWIYVLKDWNQAEEHCNKVYQTNKEIFFKLLNICIEPSEPTSIGIVLPEFQLSPITDNRFIPQLDKALEIMKKYGDKLNSSLAIKLLSSAFNIKDLLPFARNSLIRQSSQLNQSVFLRNIQFYNRLLTNLKRCLAAQKSFVVDKGSRCTVCSKFMGSAAFARNPDGSLVHYGCCENLPKLK